MERNRCLIGKQGENINLERRKPARIRRTDQENAVNYCSRDEGIAINRAGTQLREENSTGRETLIMRNIQRRTRLPVDKGTTNDTTTMYRVAIIQKLRQYSGRQPFLCRQMHMSIRPHRYDGRRHA